MLLGSSRQSIAAILLISFFLPGCTSEEPRAGDASQLDAMRARGDGDLENARDVSDLVGTREAPTRQAESSDTNAAESSVGREWKSPDGGVLGVGQLVSLMDENVCIETADGLGAVIALSALCQADREYARSRGRATPPSPDTPTAARDLAAYEAEGPAHAPVVETHETSGPLQAVPDQARDAYARQKVVVPFDFVSRFDDGRYGQKVGDMIWKKLEREGGVVIPESMLDVRDMCAAAGVQPGPDSSIEEMGRLVRDRFDADIGIWGSIERAEGHAWDVYDLTIRCVDFKSEGGPKVIYEAENVRTETVSEIPHLYVKNMLDKLYDRRPAVAMVDPLAETNWLENPNLVVGGDFEKGAGGVPIGWESTGGQDRLPLGHLVQWVSDTADPANKVIRFAFDEGVGNGFGVMYYSKAFPITEGAKYRFQCRYRSNGPTIIIFIKCYDLMDSEYDATGQRSISGREAPDERQLRECYRAQMNMKGPKNQWNTHTEDFTPRHTKYSPRYAKVDLYAYLGAGVVEFDDIVVKEIVPASDSGSAKDPRHSMESGVTIREMDENEQRALEESER